VSGPEHDIVGSAHTAPPAGSPSDYDTLEGVLQTLAADGYDGEADAREGGTIRWRRCGHESPAGDVQLAALRRMEGASDPADMLAVIAAPCPRCGDRASLVLHYGPTAGAADNDVLAALPA
jgi:hypothetical protein